MRTAPVLPGSTIGIVGGGQLGRMLALEARRMGYGVIVLDPGENTPAAQIADVAIRAPLDDVDAARELARRSDVVTLEWENADVGAVRALAEHVPVRPGAHVLEVAQHRVREKDTARRLGLETADYRAVASIEELRRALTAIGTPALLKTARGGYDGKGQRLLRSTDEAEAAFTALRRGSAELILEALVDFRMEASVICARSPAGDLACFPIAENRHRQGILDTTVAPARLPAAVLRRARHIGEAMAEGLDVVGLLAVELFVDHDDHVLVNEIAPRPHNSGHYTWEACSVSQFEQQIRAVCGLPLAKPELLRPAAMANLLGEHVGNPAQIAAVVETLAVPGVALHLYGKRESRAGRKMGHLTALAAEPEAALERASHARTLLARGLPSAATPAG
jgi:5-(carboxyamino)imidazole ribonucleotide synthase